MTLHYYSEHDTGGVECWADESVDCEVPGCRNLGDSDREDNALCELHSYWECDAEGRWFDPYEDAVSLFEEEEC